MPKWNNKLFSTTLYCYEIKLTHLELYNSLSYEASRDAGAQACEAIGFGFASRSGKRRIPRFDNGVKRGVEFHHSTRNASRIGELVCLGAKYLNLRTFQILSTFPAMCGTLYHKTKIYIFNDLRS